METTQLQPAPPSISPQPEYVIREKRKKGDMIVISILIIMVLALGIGLVLSLVNRPNSVVQTASTNTNVQPISQAVIQQPVTQCPQSQQCPVIPSNDPYTGWNTYENSQYGFTLKYPTETTLQTDFSGGLA